MGRTSGQDLLDTKLDAIDTIIDDIHGTDLPAVKTVADGIETHVHSIETKVDTLDTILDDLHGTDIPDIHTDIADVHGHVSGLTYAPFMANASYYRCVVPIAVYGLGSDSLIEAGNVTPMTVTGGAAAAGTCTLLNDGSSLGSSSYFWSSHMVVTAVSSANLSSIVTLNTGTIGANVAATSITEADDYVNKSTHGLENGDRVIFNTLSDETKGITTKIVYWVVEKTADNFKVSLTQGGSAINITADLTGNYKKVTANAPLGSILVNETATACGSHYYDFQNTLRYYYGDALWAYAVSPAGKNVTVSFHLVGNLNGYMG